MSDGGNSGEGIFGTRRAMWRALPHTARVAALPCSQPAFYDPHAAGGAP